MLIGIMDTLTLNMFWLNVCEHKHDKCYAHIELLLRKAIRGGQGSGGGKYY